MSALDQVSERMIEEVLVELRERGATLIVVSHKPATVGRADRVVMMEAGCVLV